MQRRDNNEKLKVCFQKNKSVVILGDRGQGGGRPAGGGCSLGAAAAPSVTVAAIDVAVLSAAVTRSKDG